MEGLDKVSTKELIKELESRKKKELPNLVGTLNDILQSINCFMKLVDCQSDETMYLDWIFYDDVHECFKFVWKDLP